MHDELWNILKSQPGVGVLVIDYDGRLTYMNLQARMMYFGTDFDPTGQTVEEFEGPEFAAERLAVIRKVLDTNQPMSIRHMRRGKRTEATLWPLKDSTSGARSVLVIARQLVGEVEREPEIPVFESQLVDLGPLNVLSRRELEVMALIGHGVPLKSIAHQLGISQRSVERHRTSITRKLKLGSTAEIVQLVQTAGLELKDADLQRLKQNRRKSGP